MSPHTCQAAGRQSGGWGWGRGSLGHGVESRPTGRQAARGWALLRPARARLPLRQPGCAHVLPKQLFARLAPAPGPSPSPHQVLQAHPQETLVGPALHALGVQQEHWGVWQLRGRAAASSRPTRCRRRWHGGSACGRQWLGSSSRCGVLLVPPLGAGSLSPRVGATLGGALRCSWGRSGLRHLPLFLCAALCSQAIRRASRWLCRCHHCPQPRLRSCCWGLPCRNGSTPSRSRACHLNRLILAV